MVSGVSGRVRGAGERRQMPADREAHVGPGEHRVQPRAPLSGPLWPTVCASVWGPRGRVALVHPAPPCSFHRLCSTFSPLSRVPLWWGGGWGWRALTHGGGPLPQPWELAGLGAVPLMPPSQRRQRSQGEAEAESGQLVQGSQQGAWRAAWRTGIRAFFVPGQAEPRPRGPLPTASAPCARPRPRSKPGAPPLRQLGSEPPPWRLLGASSGPSPSALPSFREPWTWGAQAGTPAPPPGVGPYQVPPSCPACPESSEPLDVGRGQKLGSLWGTRLRPGSHSSRAPCSPRRGS